ncbi:YbaN family protein [bacterium]|nr:YbaN family protein [bacterium]
MKNKFIQYIYIIAGWFSLSVGIIGVFLPILPTTPFILLAAFCFSRGSVKYHRWLRQHRYFGKAVRDWETYRGMRIPAKVMATALLSILFSISLIFLGLPGWIKISLLIIALAVLIYIWSLPTPPTKNDSTTILQKNRVA